jgi:hypothetical protein
MSTSRNAVGEVEMIRDGGSFAASYDDGHGHTYTLFIRSLREVGPNGTELLGYAEPVLQVNRVAQAIPTSWAEARALFDQVRQAVGDDQNPKWLELMSEIIARKGEFQLHF